MTECYVTVRNITDIIELKIMFFFFDMKGNGWKNKTLVCFRLVSAAGLQLRCTSGLFIS